jgi:thiol-disulfide isomerase/thioredoxin
MLNFLVKFWLNGGSKMDKDKKMLLSIVAVLVVIASVIGSLALKKQEDQPITKNDALKFKEEYEALNGTINEQNKMTYPTVEVKETNPIRYLSDDEAAKKLKNGTGLFYFGFSSCPWCRSMVPILLKAASNTSLGEINYVDIKNIRDQLVLDDNDKIVVRDEGTNGYQEILKALDSVLEPYYLKNKEGKNIDTKEKRLYAPTVVVVKEGKILDIHVDTVKSQTNAYTPLDQKQQEELYDIYQKMILKLLDSTCDESC